MALRRDAYLHDDSIGDIEELQKFYEGRKESLDYWMLHAQKKTALLSARIKELREEFREFLRVNNLPQDYPIFNEVLSDDVYPDDVSESQQDRSEEDIESARTKIFSDQTTLQTRTVLERASPIQREIEEYIDRITKLWHRKAELDNEKEFIEGLQKRYKSRIENNETLYTSLRTNLEKLNTMLRHLREFSMIFTLYPSAFTSEDKIRQQDVLTEKYGSFYASKKKRIVRTANNLAETFSDSDDAFSDSVFSETMNEIKTYFLEGLPATYKSAIDIRDVIVAQVESLSQTVISLVGSAHVALDQIRGSEGVDNPELDQLISNSRLILQSAVRSRNVSQDNLDDIVQTNQRVLVQAQNAAKEFNANLQAGIDSVNERFANAQKRWLRKMALSIGYPVENTRSGSKNYEETVRERVRQKFGGNLPFCDEVIVQEANGQNTFVKRDEATLVGGVYKRKSDIAAQKILGSTRDEINPLH